MIGVGRAARTVVVGLALVVTAACLPEIPVSGPEFVSSIAPVSRQRLGLSWRPGCPVPPEELRLVTLTYLGFDDKPHHGELVVNRRIAEAVVRVFHTLYDARFPIRRMQTSEVFLSRLDFRPDGTYIERLDVPDIADDTSAFMCRRTTQAASWSAHAYGLAVDVNPLENPYVRRGRVVPINGRPYLDRNRPATGLIRRGSIVVQAFRAAGLSWGGDWSSLKDYMHFTATGH